ncbi:MAG: ExbD/TolR family protein [Burkholderiaceae bacterium]|jgi:biopolymer transport protein TolR|nr:ExbD/TolR family protein [Burkholderiaceae bacterium]
MPAVASRGRGRRTISEINMVPFIDVMLVLLIIFMVTATVITPGVINVPSAGKSARQPDDYVTVEIDKDGNYAYKASKSDPSVSASSEADLIRSVQHALRARGDLPVLVAADRDLTYQRVVAITSKLHEAGVERVALQVK